MRLIDADALIEELELEVERVDDFVARTYVRAVINDIKKYPSAEKRGKWVEYPYCLRYDGALTEEDIACSSCGAVFNVIDNCTETFKYCPNCGARMEE